MSNAGSIKHPALRKLLDAVLDSILPSEEAPPLPRVWRDSRSNEVDANDAEEFIISIRVHPGGMTASAIVEPVCSKAQSIQGPIDTYVLSTKLV